jgi:hypothetical protein
MRKALIVLVAAAAALAMAPASAKTFKKATVKLSATPCAVACSYWQPHASNPSVWAGSLSGNPSDGNKQDAFACTNPSPAGSYADVVVTAPAGAKLLLANYRPTVDWDVFICLKPKVGNNGPMVGEEDFANTTTPNSPSYASTKVRPGVKYVIRAYNWVDYDFLKLTYQFFG